MCYGLRCYYDVAYDVAGQDPDHGPLAVGDACQKVASVSVPRQTMLWTCGIAVQGDYNCGGGERALPARLHRESGRTSCMRCMQ